MKAALPMTLAILAVTSACSSLDRSRNLANSAVPAKTTALQVCSNCHGIDGNAISPNFPSLAGQSKAYLVAQLKEFRQHSRADKAAIQYMWGLTRNLTDAQIDGLAAYYSALEPRSPGAGNSRQISMGEEIFQNGVPSQNLKACTTCHGDLGQGTAIAPRVASQHAAYVVKQLVGFQNTNDRPDGLMMKEMCQGLTPQNMADVAQYVQGISAGKFVEKIPNETPYARNGD